MTIRELIGFINRHVSGAKVEVGRIDLRPRFSFFEVPESEAQRVLQAMQGLQHKGRRVGVDLAEPAPSSSSLSSSSSGATSGRRSVASSDRPKSRAQRRFERALQSEPKKNGRKQRGQDKQIAGKGKGRRKDDWQQFFKKK